MKRILVFGAGLVSRPGVTYLLRQPGLEVTVASRTVAKAAALVEGYANGRAVAVDVEDVSAVSDLVRQSDIVISLVPWIHHLKIARMCIEHGKHMATTSYVSADMRKLDGEVRARGLLFLNEIGVDPGIDHMSAMQIIDATKAAGGQVTDFYSFCGGLPAPEANTNPFGYKFSWSPRGVVLASRNPARYLENGQVIDVPGPELFLNVRRDEIDNLGTYEVYPNRDSMPYMELYGLEGARTLMRGTYRNLGWCATLKKIVDLGLVDDTPDATLRGQTWRGMMARQAGAAPGEAARPAVARFLGLPATDPILDRMEWLGLFADQPVPDLGNRLDVLCQLLQDRLVFAPGERDMIILRHTFHLTHADGARERVTSTLIDFGEPGGDTSMARTVSLPLAIGVDLMAQGRIPLIGVQIPTRPEIYQPVMNTLETVGIRMDERRSPLAG